LILKQLLQHGQRLLVLGGAEGLRRRSPDGWIRMAREIGREENRRRVS
jgi:hypothetical protein